MTVNPIRSALMARIRSKDTSPEVRLRKALWARGRRYRVDSRTPAGRPDLVFPGQHFAVFVDGCFWHGCPDHYVRPRSRSDFWARKLRENVERDRRQTLALEACGWSVHRVWEHDIEERLEEVVAEVEAALQGGGPAAHRNSWRVVKVEPLDASGDHERRTMEELRNRAAKKVEVGPRSTQKWKLSPTGGAS